LPVPDRKAQPRRLCSLRVTVVGVMKPGERFTYATKNTVLEAGDLLIVSGPIDDVEGFAERT
jgi:trk system potassium uptake protein